MARLAAINKYLADQFNRQLKAGYDQIAAAAALSRQISANNDAMIASIDAQLAASRTRGGGTDTSGTAKFDDYIRGVTTVDDPYYGTSQHSSDTSFHWTDGYGNYRNSNEATYDPNRTEVGSWVPMKAIRQRVMLLRLASGLFAWTAAEELSWRAVSGRLTSGCGRWRRRAAGRSGCHGRAALRAPLTRADSGLRSR